MKAPGAFKISNRHRVRRVGVADLPSHSFDALLAPLLESDERLQRILTSLRQEIVEGGRDNLRIRRVFQSPREIFRLEIDLPDLGYQRTTLLDREALEELLSADDVRELVSAAALG